VWHVSIGGMGDTAARRLTALRVLGDAGDAVLGEWWEEARIATHLRRRVTQDEAATIGPVVDVRGTPEGAHRLAAVRRYLPEGMDIEQ
jgi:hypothetical protein